MTLHTIYAITMHISLTNPYQYLIFVFINVCANISDFIFKQKDLENSCSL